MSKGKGIVLTEEEKAFLDKFPEPPRRKMQPRPALLTALDGRIANVVRANPESVRVRVTAQDEEGMPVVDRPRRSTVVEVTAVDENGRPKTCVTYDPATWQRGSIEFKDGYAPASGSGATHAYDPLDALKGD